MLRFFRKIRHELLKKKSFNSYLLLGIGEVILVVFGIVIALQFDNWNDNRQAKNQLTINLEKMFQDLQLDSLNIQLCKNQYQRSYQRGLHLWNQLYNEEPLPEAPNFIYETQAIARTIYFELNDNQFSGMFESNTLKLIPNDKLRNAILDYYTDHHAEHLFELMQERNIEFHEMVVDAIPLDAHIHILQGDTLALKNWVDESEGVHLTVFEHLQENESLSLALKNTIRSYLLSLAQLNQKAQQNSSLRSDLAEFLFDGN